MTKNFIEDATTITAKNLLNNNTDSNVQLNYWMENEGDTSVWWISINGNEPHRLTLEWEAVTYGDRAYLCCPSCERRGSKLYLPTNGNQFKCKDCHNMIYRLQTFNKNSVAGKMLYKMNRMQKLADKRATMGRILYNGIYTKKYERFLTLCDKAGYTSIVKGAEQLRELINA